MAERIRFYTDEHVGRAVVRGLRQRGVDVLTVPEAALLGAADEVQLRFARKTARVIFTQDDDFLRLAAAGVPHAGIVYAMQGTAVGRIVRGLVLIHQVLEPEEIHGQIEYL